MLKINAKPSLGHPVELVVSEKTHEPEAYLFLLTAKRTTVVELSVNTDKTNMNWLNIGIKPDPNMFKEIASQMSVQ